MPGVWCSHSLRNHTKTRLHSFLWHVCWGGSCLGDGGCSVPGSQCRGNRWCFRESQGWKVVTHHAMSKGHWAKCPQGEVVHAFHVECMWNLNGRHWEHCFVWMESWKATLNHRDFQLSFSGLRVGHIQGCLGEIKCFCLFLSCVCVCAPMWVYLNRRGVARDGPEQDSLKQGLQNLGPWGHFLYRLQLGIITLKERAH